MKTKIKHKPPFFDFVIRWFFSGYRFEKVMAVTFGDTIYSHLNPIPDHILLHEKVHLRQMKYSKFWGAIHFIRFVLSDEFKYKVELEAYKEVYQYIRKVAPNQALEAAQKYADILSGQGDEAYVYGSLVSYEEALTDIIL